MQFFNRLMTSELRHAAMFTLVSYFVRENNAMKWNMYICLVLKIRF